jgi:hypothetical protein
MARADPEDCGMADMPSRSVAADHLDDGIDSKTTKSLAKISTPYPPRAMTSRFSKKRTAETGSRNRRFDDCIPPGVEICNLPEDIRTGKRCGLQA